MVHYRRKEAATLTIVRLEMVREATRKIVKLRAISQARRGRQPILEKTVHISKRDRSLQGEGRKQ
jgi:hypothetical protein